MSKDYTFTIQKVERSDDQREGSWTTVTVRDADGKEHRLSVPGWHDPESLLAKVKPELHALAVRLAIQESETALIGTSITVTT